MNNPVRTVALTSLALTGLGGALTWSSEGEHFATGVVATGLTMLGSLVMGAYAMGRVERAAGASKKALAVPFVLKMPIMLGAGWLLLSHFPPLSVILGGGTLVAAITLHAALGSFLPTAAQPGAGSPATVSPATVDEA